MMVEPHYDEEALIAMLEENGEESLRRDPHIATCKTCSTTLASVRELAQCLKSPDVWDRTEISPEPNPNVLAFLDRTQKEMRTEDTAAERWVRELLASPREVWASTLHAHPEWRTAGMVRKLIEATDRAIETMPPDALEITSLAVEIAEGLAVARYGHSTTLRLRGHAWRERAYALFFTGSYNEAVWAVERSRKAFAECGYSEFDDARSAVVSALIYTGQEKFGGGLQAARSAADAFNRYGSHAKTVAAQRSEAIILFALRRFREALALYAKLETEPLPDGERAALAQNIALCHRELGNFELAGRYFTFAIELCSKLGLLTLIARTRWHLGRTLFAQGRHVEALAVFRQVRDEFKTAGMATEVAEITTDIAHALVLTQRLREVIDECHRALEYFTVAGLSTTEPAMSAISFLHEAAAAGRLDENIVADTRIRVMNSRPAQPRLYAQ